MTPKDEIDRIKALLDQMVPPGVRRAAGDPPLTSFEQYLEMGQQTADEREQFRIERDVLRAVLAPLLNAGGYNRFSEDTCVFCAQYPSEGHAPDCPVLRRDELLGR